MRGQRLAKVCTGQGSRTNDIAEGRCLAKTADKLSQFNHSLHIYGKCDAIMSASPLVQ